MTPREAGSNNETMINVLRRLPSALRPGVVLALAVIGLVGIAGIVQWDQQLILLGLVAGVAIVLLNVVIVAARHWHGRNTDPGALYLEAEDMVRLGRPKTKRR